MNRDPAGELGGSLEAFLANQPLAAWDYLGMLIKIGDEGALGYSVYCAYHVSMQKEKRCPTFSDLDRKLDPHQALLGHSMLDYIKDHSGDPNCVIPKIDCTKRAWIDDGHSGAFDRDEKVIYIYGNYKRTLEARVEALLHELTHAYDHCRGILGECGSARGVIALYRSELRARTTKRMPWPEICQSAADSVGSACSGWPGYGDAYAPLVNSLVRKCNDIYADYLLLIDPGLPWPDNPQAPPFASEGGGDTGAPVNEELFGPE